MVIKLLALGLLLSISVAFVFIISALLARLVIHGILFSTSLTFVLRAAVVTEPVILGALFSISVAFVFRSLFLTCPLVLGFFLSISQSFFQNSVC